MNSNNPTPSQFLPQELIIVEWLTERPAPAPVPTTPPEPAPTYANWVLKIVEEFEPTKLSTRLLPPTTSEFEPLAASPTMSTHGAPYLTAAEINALLAPHNHKA